MAKGREIYLPGLRTPFRRWFIASTLIPLVLLALAVAVRIRAYGITEDRYMLGAHRARWLPLGWIGRAPAPARHPSLTGCRLAPWHYSAAVGPLSARNVTIRNQAERARTILASVPAERWATAKDGGLTEQQKQDLLGAVARLQELVGTEPRELGACLAAACAA